MVLHTPLYDRHVQLGGKMVAYAGYELPVEYPAGLVAEHLAVRQQAGLFDVSHMGEFTLRGAGALAWLNNTFTNAFDSLKPGRVRYTLLCNENGGCLDDLIVYCVSRDHYVLVVNAANRAKDYAWLCEHLTEDVTLDDVSDQIALLALQGPRSAAALAQISEGELPTRNYSFAEDVRVCGKSCWVARTGYTGEYGFEIFLKPADAELVWDSLLAVVNESGEQFVSACGLGARDTLRLEAGMPLYGHEMTDAVNPLEAGLEFAVKLDKEFIGRDAIRDSVPVQRKRVGLRVLDKGIVREDAELYVGDTLVGRTTSGTFAPHLEAAIAMGLVNTESSAIGTVLEAQVRKRRLRAEVVELPFYKANK